MIRVLQVMGSLNSGGSQTMIMNIYRKINRNKIQFDFIIDRKDEVFYLDEITKMGGRVYVLPQYKVYNSKSFKKAWNNFFREHPEYRIIHGHVRSTASIYLKIAKKYDLYTIAHSHSISSGNGIKAIIKNILQYKIRFVADYFMGCSEEANKWLFGKKIANSDRCIVLNNGIDLEKFSFNKETRKNIRNKLKINDNEILLGHVGRFVQEKNHEFIFKIYSKIYSKNSNYKLVLIGDGELKEKLINKYRNQRFMQNVIFTGTIENVNEYMQAMDIFIMPSKFEGLGIVLIEAQCSGMQCFASNTIPMSAKVTSNLHFISLNKNAEYWSEKIIEAYNKHPKRDMKAIEDVSKNGYDIKTTTRFLEKFYENNAERNKNSFNNS